MSVAEQEKSLKRKKNLEAKELEIKRLKILGSAQKEAEALQEQIDVLKNKYFTFLSLIVNLSKI